MATPIHANTSQLSRYSAVSNLLESFNEATYQSNKTTSQHQALLDLNGSKQTGLQYLEIPALNSQSRQKSTRVNTPRANTVTTVSTAREKALSRLATVIKNDRTKVAQGSRSKTR